MCCYCGGKHHLQVLRLLLAQNVDVNSIDEFGCTPLIRAAMNGRASVAHFYWSMARTSALEIMKARPHASTQLSCIEVI